MRMSLFSVIGLHNCSVGMKIASFRDRFFPFVHLCSSRNTSQPYSHYGQAGSGFVLALQAGDREGRSGRGYQQETVEGDYQRTQPAYLNHQCSLHPPHTVSTHRHTPPWKVNSNSNLSVCCDYRFLALADE